MVETKEEKEHVNVGANAGSSSLLQTWQILCSESVS